MDDPKWLEFLDLISIEKKLTTVQKTTLKAKFPTFNGMANDRDLIEKFGLTDTGWKKRLGKSYKIFGIEGDGNDKATPLQKHLQQESLNWQCKQEQDSIDTPPIPIPTTPIQPPTTPQIDWLDRSRQLLEAQKYLTTNRLLKESNRKIDDDINVGLVERKERPKMKEVEDAAQGSQLYHPVEYTDTKRYEHKAFLTEVVGKPVGGKHIAIIGEPGAGKTTILTKIGVWLIGQAEQQPVEPLVVAWISLASLETQTLSEYFYGSWLDSAHPAACPPPSWKDELIKLVGQKRVWLLLDGLDELSQSNAPNWLNEQLSGWGQNLRVVMTCRINQWEAAAGGNILTNSFDVCHTLDYSYRTSQGEDQVEKFISNWFGDKEQEVAHQIRRELDAPGKERIKDLVKNPLRLTLLCASWEQDRQALPETQAELYHGFVNYLYGWKADKFPKEVKLRDELNFALGILAKTGLNRVSINDGAVRRFRFTDREIRQLWKKHNLPDTLLRAAEDLGWLNVVEKDPSNPFYAFYHPTFQEYFAACDIKHWNYFLPEVDKDLPAITCLDEIEQTFRVFEKQWQHVILFWIGRHDIRDNCKNEFVEKLTNFKEMEFYDVQAYCIAATCTSEFIDFHKSKDIVAKIVEWAFGYLTEEKEWQQPVEPIESLAKATIPFIHRGHAIEILMSLLLAPDHTDNNIANVLGKIAVGNKAVINRLFELIEQKSSQYNLRILSQLLGNILIGSQEEIDRLIKLLNDNDLDTWLRGNLVEALGKISIGNKGVIDSLVRILNEENLYSYFHIKIIYTLGDIAIQNEVDIMILLQILERDNLRGDVTNITHSISSTLSKIAVGNDLAIDKIVEILNNGNLDDKINYRSSVEILGKIGAGKQAAISALVRTFNKETLADELRCLALQELGIIATGNEETITALIQSLSNENLGGYFQSKILKVLSEIAVESQATISFLGEILKKDNTDDCLRSNIASTLFRIDKDNKKAIDILHEILNRNDLDDSLCIQVICILMEIDDHDNQAIKALLKLLKKLDNLHPNLCDNILCLLEHANIEHQDIVVLLFPFIGTKDLGHNFHFVLRKIAVGNEMVIKHLLIFLEDDKFKYTSLEILRKIAIGNSDTVDRLVQLLQQDNVDDEFRSHLVIVLEEIVTKETMPSVILKLKNYITEKTYKSNFSQFHDCYKILFCCAQNLSYSKFYALWYSTNINPENS